MARGAHLDRGGQRLNPFPPNLYHWYHALALYSGHEYGQAIKTLKETRSLDRWAHGLLAACYAQIGSLGKARSEADVFVSSGIVNSRRKVKRHPQTTSSLLAFEPTDTETHATETTSSMDCARRVWRADCGDP